VWEDFILNATYEIGRRICAGNGKAKLTSGYVSEEVLEVSLSSSAISFLPFLSSLSETQINMGMISFFILWL